MDIYCGQCGKFILTSDIDWPHEAICKNCQKNDNAVSWDCYKEECAVYVLVEERYEDYVGVVDYRVVIAGNTEGDLRDYMYIKDMEGYPTPDGGVGYQIHKVEKFTTVPVVVSNVK